MGRRRSAQQLLDEATRLVIAYNKAVLLDYDAPSVQLDIPPRMLPTITIWLDEYEVLQYGGGNLKRGQTFRDGVMHVKRLLKEYRAKEAKADADETGD